MHMRYMPLAAALALTLSAAPAYAAAVDVAAEAAQDPAPRASTKQQPREESQPLQTISREQEDKLIAEAKRDHTPDSYVEDKDGRIFKTARLRRAATSPDYRLFKGDSVSMLVVGFPDGIGMNGFTVGTDGYVQLPYVGSVKFEGLTLDQAKGIIMQALGQYIKIPDMSLQITTYGPRKVYVMGEVAHPGIVNMSIDDMNAYAALWTAGGWTNHGLSTGVQIMRVQGDKLYWRKLNMKSYAKRRDLAQNVVIEDGDILYVPKSNGIKWQEDILPWFNAWAFYKAITK